MSEEQRELVADLIDEFPQEGDPVGNLDSWYHIGPKTQAAIRAMFMAASP